MTVDERFNRIEKKLDMLIAQLATNPAAAMMDVAQVAVFIRRSRKTIYNYVQEGRIPFVKNEGRLLFRRSEIEAWLQDGKQKDFFKHT